MALRIRPHRLSVALLPGFTKQRAPCRPFSAAPRPAASQASTQTSNLSKDAQQAIRREASLPTPDPPSDSQTQTLLDQQSPYMVPTYVRPPLIIAKGSGSHVYDVENREYIDFTAGIAVNALGHCDPEVSNVIAAQSATLMHASNLYHNPWTPLLSQTLVEKTRKSAAAAQKQSGVETAGFPTASRAFICNSGSEANEAALKFARKYAVFHHNRQSSSASTSTPSTTEQEQCCSTSTTPCASPSANPNPKHHILSFSSSFHGRTMFALSATPNPKYQAPFSPMVPGFSTAPFNSTAASLDLITPRTCAVIIEPIQGEGGVNTASPSFLQALRAKCDKVGALLIYDEIQCGIGRTGSLWACDRPGVPAPDILTTAKALGNGFPIGATLVSEEVANAVQVGDHGTTFGGNPVACRVGCHILGRISGPEFLAEVVRKGELFRGHFERLRKRFPGFIQEIRGRGLLLGVQLSERGDVAKVITAARERGLLVISCGVNALRIVPPLVIEDEAVEKGMAVLEGAMESLWVEGGGVEGTTGQQEMGENPAVGAGAG
ncbi:MAG: acetylornithine aminotransferase [Chrysothrix sp. TS-e1954]|nr:MAG: acetylornithine aminotransferase [Chrysothrix sp. TS-e1954]